MSDDTRVRPDLNAGQDAWLDYHFPVSEPGVDGGDRGAPAVAEGPEPVKGPVVARHRSSGVAGHE